MITCKWCDDRDGGCLYCLDEIKKIEVEQTKLISEWRPLSDEEIECIRFQSFPSNEGETMGEKFARLTLLEKLRGMSKEQIEEFIECAQTPPPIFKANQNDLLELDILKQFFNANVIGDSETFPTPEARGEAARIMLRLKRSQWVGPGEPRTDKEWGYTK